MVELNQSVEYLCTLTQKLNLRDQNLKKVCVPIEIRPIVVVKNDRVDKVEDDLLRQKLSEFTVTSNPEVHLDVVELEKKEAKTKACRPKQTIFVICVYTPLKTHI